MSIYRRIRRISKVFLEKMLVPDREGIEHYDKVLPAEVLGDDFYLSLKELASASELTKILEIGSSSGEGSTRALVEGVLLRDSSDDVSIFCLEISKIRYENLISAYKDFQFVNIFRLSSVGLESFPSLNELRDFYRNVPSNLNNHTFDEVASWLRKDIEYLSLHNKELSNQLSTHGLNGIEYLKQEFGISSFDLVVIDGGEFLGWAEYELVRGSKYICLDDINTFKCRKAYDHLSADPDYLLYGENWHIRNGWAIFERKQLTQ
jgi:hypothetical protein